MSVFIWCVCLLLALLLAYRLLTLPKSGGELLASAVRGDVHITRDPYGVIHIRAAHANDAIYALGFSHGQDRLWQLELQRRAVRGELSEVLGPSALDDDRWARFLEIQIQAQRTLKSLDPQTKAQLEAYVKGINAAILDARRRWVLLSPEFALLRLSPQFWQIDDVIAWQSMFNWKNNRHWQDHLLGIHLEHRLSPELLKQWQESLQSSPQALPQQHSVIPGRNTSHGQAVYLQTLLTPIDMSSSWYLAHLSAPGLEVIGASLPGLPYLLAGRSDSFAWGMQAKQVAGVSPLGRVRLIDSGSALPEGTSALPIQSIGGKLLIVESAFLEKNDYSLRVGLRMNASESFADFQQAFNDAHSFSDDFVFLTKTNSSILVNQQQTRLDQLLANNPKITTTQIATLEKDTVALGIRDVLPFLLKTRASSSIAQDSLKALSAWSVEKNNEMAADRFEPAIVHAWLKNLRKEVFFDEFGAQAFDIAERLGYLDAVLFKVIAQPEFSAWCDKPFTPKMEDCASLMSGSLETAVTQLNSFFQTPMEQWHYGQWASKTLEHRPLSQRKGLAQFFELPVLANGFPGHTLANQAGYRAIYDLSGVNNSMFIAATGQSGHRLSPNYKDLHEKWSANEYLPMLMEKAAVEKQAQSLLILKPSNPQ